MSVANRAALITKTHKVLKKHYKPVEPLSERTLLEHLLYACCLENAMFDVADEAFGKLQESYFDWNEVRVTTVAELSETMSCLPDPPDAASRLKRTLQSVFEAHYTFDLEAMKKENLGSATKKLEKNGVTSFCVSFITQASLGGHSIPVDNSTVETLYVLGIISENEAKSKRIPGMERAIPKTKGVEFGSLLHQLAVDFSLAPFSPRVRSIISEISPDAKERFPKRGAKPAPARGEVKEKPKKKKAAAEKAKEPKKSAAKAVKKKSAKTKKSVIKAKQTKSATKKKSTTKRLAKKKPR